MILIPVIFHAAKIKNVILQIYILYNQQTGKEKWEMRKNKEKKQTKTKKIK